MMQNLCPTQRASTPKGAKGAIFFEYPLPYISRALRIQPGSIFEGSGNSKKSASRTFVLNGLVSTT